LIGWVRTAQFDSLVTMYLLLFSWNSSSQQVFPSSHFHVTVNPLNRCVTQLIVADVYRSGLGRHLWDVPISMFSPGFLQVVLLLPFKEKLEICLRTDTDYSNRQSLHIQSSIRCLSAS
jgi:hypothetical protein